jgi:phospholipid/cholesterol/gamma-HCH transport system permease protein
MPRPEGQPSAVESLGVFALAGVRYVGGMSLLMGQTVRWTALGLFSPKFRFGSEALARQVLRIGLRSVAVVALVQGFIGVILALQMTPPLKPWGQVDKVANIIGVAGFRMLGPIITAVVLSGFAGASIAAELGTMVVSEEVEALQAIALNPIRFLVVPRV